MSHTAANAEVLSQPIEAICKIRLGYSTRGKLEDNPSGNVKVLQPGDFSNGLQMREYKSIKFEDFNILRNHLLRGDEILISNKGINVFAYKVPTVTEPHIASSSFWVLQADENRVLPEYLHWYLNQRNTLNSIRSLMGGIAIESLTKQSLSSVRILIPPLEVQRKIAAHQTLLEKEIEILKKMIQNRLETIAAFGWEQLQLKNKNYGARNQ